MFIFVSQQIHINMTKVQRLTFIEPAGKDKNFNSLGRFKCECGNERVYKISEVHSMRKTACGCQRFGEANKWGKKHGFRRHPLYHTWDNMLSRCRNRDDPNFKNYGARGIGVYRLWDDINTFMEWALNNGWEKGLQLDRINNDGNYEPKNCRFVTQQENANNRRNNRFIEYNGKRQTVQQWANEIGVSSGTLRRRIDIYGYSIEAALTKPAKYK